MDKLEKEIEAKLRQAVERHGGMCLKWVCPGWSGVPDRIILLPGGRIIFVETKRPKGGRVSAMQAWWGGTLRRLGFTHWYIRDAGDIAALDDVLRTQEAKKGNGGGWSCD